jgi:hypothetical protein
MTDWNLEDFFDTSRSEQRNQQGKVPRTIKSEEIRDLQIWKGGFAYKKGLGEKKWQSGNPRGVPNRKSG